MKNVKKTRSLPSTLIKLIIIPALIAIIILVSMTVLGVALIQNQIIQRQQLVIETLAQQGDRYLDETERFMRALTHVILDLPPEGRQTLLAQSRMSYPRFATLYLVDTTGTVVAEDTDTVTLLGLDMANTRFFKEVQIAGESFFSDPFISLATGKIAVTAAVPVFSHNQWAGVLVGELNLDRLQQSIEQVDVGEQGTSFIVDRRGTLVAHPDSLWVQEQRNLNNLALVQDGLAGQQTFKIYYSQNENGWHIGSVTPMDNNWVVAAVQPALIVVRPLLILLVGAVAALGISLALYTWTQFYTARQIIQPIKMLAEKVNELSRGRYQPLSTEQMGQFAEIITLGESFNRMVEAVAERTEALLIANESIRESEARYRFLAENATDMISRHTPEGVYLYASPASKRLLGYSPEELVGQNAYEYFHPEDVEKVRQTHQDVLQRPIINLVSWRVKCKNGAYLWVETTSKTINQPESGEPQEIIAVTRDISKRKEAEAKIEASLREKEALLREIHHRVKNNLQVICALLDLQANTVADVQTREVFEESRNRVRSMAQIHEQLTYNKNMAQINMVSYIQDLVSSLRIAYGREDIAININVSEVTLPFDLVSPCGLLINELVSNAVKHAFPAQFHFAKGHIKTISINLQKRASPDQILELTVADNGVGLPEEIDPASPISLGLTLVNLLVNQLQASLEIDRQTGTTYKIQFTP